MAKPSASLSKAEYIWFSSRGLSDDESTEAEKQNKPGSRLYVEEIFPSGSDEEIFLRAIEKSKEEMEDPLKPTAPETDRGQEGSAERPPLASITTPFAFSQRMVVSNLRFLGRPVRDIRSRPPGPG